MLTRTMQIKSPVRLHIRSAYNLVNIASRFDSRIEFTKAGSTYNCKSIVSVLSSCIGYPDEITLSVSGEDEEEAMEALEQAMYFCFIEP
jgi:phosphocarrier protein HPr